nr:circumsporozoite protein-like [Bactrocera oleae]
MTNTGARHCRYAGDDKRQVSAAVVRGEIAMRQVARGKPTGSVPITVRFNAAMNCGGGAGIVAGGNGSVGGSAGGGGGPNAGGGDSLSSSPSQTSSAAGTTKLRQILSL